MCQGTHGELYQNLSLKSIFSKRLFWEVVKLFFTDKTLKNDRIEISGKKNVISKVHKFVEIFNEYSCKHCKKYNSKMHKDIIHKYNYMKVGLSPSKKNSFYLLQ